MASSPTPAATPTPTPPKTAPSEHRLQDAKVVPVPRPPVTTSADW